MKVRRSWDRLIFSMAIPIHVKIVFKHVLASCVFVFGVVHYLSIYPYISGLLHWHQGSLLLKRLILSHYREEIRCPAKCGMKLLIHSQTSTIPPSKFGNWWLIWFHTFWWIYDYLSMLELKLVHVSKKTTGQFYDRSGCQRSNHGEDGWWTIWTIKHKHKYNKTKQSRTMSLFGGWSSSSLPLNYYLQHKTLHWFVFHFSIITVYNLVPIWLI